MAAIITSRTRIFNAQKIVSAFGDAAENLYLFTGRPQGWSNDAVPDTPLDTFKQFFNVRRDLIAVKRLSASDVSLGIPRIDWVTGKFYDEYRHDYDGLAVTGLALDTGATVVPNGLFAANFFVVTDTLSVYKVISNNGGVASTVKPTSTATANFTTADGYTWKYMYSVSPADALKFVSSNFIPVKSIPSDPGSSDFYYSQFQVQQAAVNGAIEQIKVTSAGTGYAVSSSSIAVTITGDGSGATAVASSNASGQITSITITAKGSNYTFATVTVGSTGTGAVCYAIISPKDGHGSDALRELGGYYVLINTKIASDEGSGDFPSVNEYRRLGLIRNPFNFGTSTLATSPTLTCYRKLTLNLTPTGTFVQDEVITGGTSGAKGFVVGYDSVNRIVQFIQRESELGTFTVGESIIGATSTASGTIGTITQPEMNIYSGDIIYLEHRRPITRAVDQAEDIKIIIEA